MGAVERTALLDRRLAMPARVFPPLLGALLSRALQSLQSLLLEVYVVARVPSHENRRSRAQVIEVHFFHAFASVRRRTRKWIASASSGQNKTWRAKRS